MMIYASYIFLESMFYLSLSPLLKPVFNAIGVGQGMKTVVIQIACLMVTVIVAVLKKIDGKVLKEVIYALLAWLPFIGYLYLRTDQGDHYASLKFDKFVVIQYLAIVTVSLVYLADSISFRKWFPLLMITIGVALILEAVLNPKTFIYDSTVERLTVEDANPIWLARSYAYAGLACVLLSRNRIVRIAGLAFFAAWIFPTGSRGPLLSLIIVTGFRWIILDDIFNIKSRQVRVLLACMGLGIGLIASGDAIDKYLTRDSNASMLEESGRAMLFSVAWDDFETHPIIGSGFGMFSRGENNIRSTSKNTYKNGYYPHNIFLEILSETGLVGALLFTIGLRPGRWMLNFRGYFNGFFLLGFLFSMTSGDINANVGFLFFGAIARLEYNFRR